MFASLMAVQPGRRHGIDIGAIVRAVLRRATPNDWMPQKEAAITMGTSMPQLSRALDGQQGYPLDLWKLAELPVEVQAQVYARILEAAYERKRMARAELPAREKSEVA